MNSCRDCHPAKENSFSDATREWGWVLAGGIASIALGIWAWLTPFYATQGIVLGLGLVLIVAGIVQIAQAARFSKFGGTGWRVFQSLLPIAGGIVILKFPTAGTIGVGLTICFYLFMSATAQLMMGLDLSPLKGSGWLYFSSFISYVLGIILLFEMPVSAFFMPGIFLAVDLIAGGISAIGASVQMHRIHKTALLQKPPTEVSRAA